VRFVSTVSSVCRVCRCARESSTPPFSFSRKLAVVTALEEAPTPAFAAFVVGGCGGGPAVVAAVSESLFKALLSPLGVVVVLAAALAAVLDDNDGGADDDGGVDDDSVADDDAGSVVSAGAVAPWLEPAAVGAGGLGGGSCWTAVRSQLKRSPAGEEGWACAEEEGMELSNDCALLFFLLCFLVGLVLKLLWLRGSCGSIKLLSEKVRRKPPWRVRS